jgi:hypothetical protein
MFYDAVLTHSEHSDVLTGCFGCMATEAEPEGLATCGGGIGSMLPMQLACRFAFRHSRMSATRALALSTCD